MKIDVDKIIETGIDIKEITLLSIEELNSLQVPVPTEIIPCWMHHKEDGWWLRSTHDGYGMTVTNDKDRIVVKKPMSHYCGVRPVLKVDRLSSDLQIGDNVRIFGYTWTVVSHKLILCDMIVGQTVFKHPRSDDSNSYEISDIKKWLDKWYKVKLLMN